MKILILLVIRVPFCFAGDSLKINSSMLFGSEYKAEKKWEEQESGEGKTDKEMPSKKGNT